jgi:predicted phage terminase large subunit-like protein
MQIIGPGSGKSVAISQVFPTAVLGRDPTQNILCVSGAEALATGFQNVVMNYVEGNDAFKQVFPTVKPDKSAGWSSTAGMFVSGHRPSSPDASFWSAGISSKALTGKHGTILIFDDLHDEENSSTEEQCLGVVRKYVMQLTGRADPMGARFLMAGRRWHESDLYGTLKDNGDWVVLTLPAERPDSRRLWYDIVVPVGIECVFTDGKCQAPDGTMIDVISGDLSKMVVKVDTKENGVVLRHIEWVYGEDPEEQGFFWPASKHKRQEYFNNKRLLPAETEAVYQCNPGARQGVVFLDSDFDRRFALPDDAELGVQSPAMRKFLGNGATVVQGWDTAFSANATSDFSVCVTLMLVPCDEYHRGEDPAELGECEAHFDVYVLDVWRDRIKFAGVAPKMREMFHKWQPSAITVENKAYAVGAIEALENSGMPIEAVNPGPLESKRARAVEGVGAGSVQGWARQGRLLVPYEAPWLEAFIREMKDFTGTKGGTDDQVDALVYGVRWAIRNGSAAGGLPTGWNSESEIEGQMHRSEQPMDALATFVGNAMQTEAFNPFGECCGYCKHFNKVSMSKGLPSNRDRDKLPLEYCLLHSKKVSTIYSCDDFADADDTAFTHPFFGGKLNF